MNFAYYFVSCSIYSCSVYCKSLQQTSCWILDFYNYKAILKWIYEFDTINVLVKIDSDLYYIYMILNFLDHFAILHLILKGVINHDVLELFAWYYNYLLEKAILSSKISKLSTNLYCRPYQI